MSYIEKHPPHFDIHKVSSDRFSWKDGHGLADASEIGAESIGLIWNDKIDVGFYIRSEKTGKEKIFYLKSVQRDEDGTILIWNYIDDFGCIKVTIFNS
jgi:hypothetical protein